MAKSRTGTAVPSIASKTVDVASSSPRGTMQPNVRTPAIHDAMEQSIRVRAYQKWEEAGKPNTDPERFWLEAEQEVMLGSSATTARSAS
jgi:hypothetical protein